MSLLQARTADLSGFVTASRTNGAGPSNPHAPRVTMTSAMRQSVVWAATRLRADIVSLMPVDVFRKVPGLARGTVVDPPPVLVSPSQIADGHPVTIREWLGSGQTNLDRSGNNVGVIRARDAFSKPAQIELVDPMEVGFHIRGRQILYYRINGERHEPRDIWHERQYTIGGLPVGLSPIAFAATQLAVGLSAEAFALDWFLNGAVPSAILQNIEKTLNPVQARAAKEQFRASVKNGEPFAMGKDWTYSAVQAKATESAFIEQQQYTDVDLCRFMGVPGDTIDVQGLNAGTITYANITQRNLQLLVMNLGGTIGRREDALSELTPRPRYVKLNRSAVLAMDAKTRAELYAAGINVRSLTPDEARALEDREPLTEDDYAQFERLWPTSRPGQPTTTGGA